MRVNRLIILTSASALLSCGPNSDGEPAREQLKQPAGVKVEATEPQREDYVVPATEPQRGIDVVAATPPPEQPRSAPAKVEDTEPSPPELQPTDPFEARLAELPKTIDSLAAANAVFVELHQTSAEIDEIELRAHLDRLLVFLEAQLGGVMTSDIYAIAECKVYGPADCMKTMPAEALASFDTLEASGIQATKGGEGSVDIGPNHAKLADLLAPALSDLSRSYLAALVASERARDGLDDGMYFGDPDDDATVIVHWESLANSGSPAYADCHGRTRAAVERYLYLCTFEDSGCRVDPKMQASYRRFLSAHATSTWRPVIECFYAGAKASKFQLTEEAYSELVNACMALAPPTPEYAKP